MNAEELMKRGYRRISRKHNIVARIDRFDWEAECGVINGTQASKEDWYRRVLSRDKIQTVEAQNVRASGDDTTGFVMNDKQVINQLQTKLMAITEAVNGQVCNPLAQGTYGWSPTYQKCWNFGVTMTLYDNPTV